MFKKLFSKPISESHGGDEDTFPVFAAGSDDHMQSPFAIASHNYPYPRPNNRRSSLGGIPRGGVDMTTPNERVMDLLDSMLNDERINNLRYWN